MAMTRDEAIRQFGERLRDVHEMDVHSDVYQKMLDIFGTGYDGATDKDAYLKSMEKLDDERPAMDVYWKNLARDFTGFIQSAPDEYNNGYYSNIAGFINRERAEKSNDVTFVDPYTTALSGRVQEDLDAQSGKNKKVLLTGTAMPSTSLGTSGSDLEKFLERFDTASVKPEDYERVIIPISAQFEPDPNNPQGTLPGHAFVLVWDTKDKKAMIVDQAGKGTHPDSKKKIKDLLVARGVTVSYNDEWLTGQNRNDCAAVASLIIEDALAGKALDDFKQKELYGNNNDFSKIDARHQEDQKLLLQAMFRVYENSPIFKIYCEAKGIDWNNINEDEKKRVIDGFKLFKDAGDFSLGDHTQDSPNNDFIAVVKPYVDEILAKHPKRQFTQYQDTEHPNALAYKHQDGSKIIITSETSAHIESKTLEDHMILCEHAKNMGCKNMDFGPYFKTHLEEAALLYLASLKTGMGVKNAPDIEKFKAFPQYDEIKLRLTVQQELKDLQEKKDALANNPDYKKQKEIMAQNVDKFKAFLNTGSPQQQVWVDLTEANKAAKKAKDDLTAGLEGATPEEKALLDKVRSEQHKNKAENKTETVAEIVTRLAGQGQQVDVSKVENLVTLHENVDASRAKVQVASNAFKAEIPNITAPEAKEYCEAWVAAQANPVYRAFRDAEAGYKNRIDAAFDEYLGNCTPEQRVERIVGLKEGLTGQAMSDAEKTQLKDNTYHPEGQKMEDKQKVDITQLIYARSYRGM